MWYFENFPTINYQVSNSQNNVIPLVDITKRFKFREDVIKNRYILFEYTIKENETPDMIANNYYRDVTLDWIIFLTNKVIDPYFDWPLSSQEFQDYISKKYLSVAEAKQKIYTYQKIVQKKEMTYDGFSVPEKTINIDEHVFLDTPLAERKTISWYDWEFQNNEDKRKIKLIDKRYVADILKEFNTIYAN